MSAILDRGSLLWASLSVVVVSFLIGHWLPLPFYGPLLALAVAYVPGILLLCGIFGRLGGFVVSFQRDYSPMLTCAGTAWAAANRSHAEYRPIDATVIKAQQAESDAFLGLGVIPKKLVAKDLFDTRYNKVVAALSARGA